MDGKSTLWMIGRIDKMGRRVVFMNEPPASPIPGPWDLRAVITV
jgi:hypothetical protein